MAKPPLLRPSATPELGYLRRRGHSLLDPIWQAAVRKKGYKKAHARELAYKWLAKLMRVDRGMAHFGQMDIETARRAVAALERFYGEVAAATKGGKE